MTDTPQPAPEPYTKIDMVIDVMSGKPAPELLRPDELQMLLHADSNSDVVVFAGRKVMRKTIDGKFTIGDKYIGGKDGLAMEGFEIINKASGEAIPPDEPLFLLRGRDALAVMTLLAYKRNAISAKCNDLHIAGCNQVIQYFQDFAALHPERMKQPGITRHLKLEADNG